MIILMVELMMMNFMVDEESGVDGRDTRRGDVLAVVPDGAGSFRATFGATAREREITVSDLNGRLVARQPVLPGSRSLRVSLPSASTGPLFVMLEHEGAKVMLP